ncbi:MAG: SUMF1/EgtB/PvdO family nonheme iron enzyme [Opitutia bacterium]
MFDGVASKQILRGDRRGDAPTLNPKFEISSPQRKADLRQEARSLAMQQLRDRLLLPLVGLVLLVGLLTGAWLISKDQRSGSSAAAISPEEIAALKAEVEEKERNFSTLVQRKARINEEDLAELEAAVTAQERLVALAGITAAETSRLDSLRTRLHVYRAERLRESSLQLEKDAEAARAAGNPDVAIAKLAEALSQERMIREKWMLSNLEDNGRIARIDIRLRRMQADPLWELGRKLERDAEAAARDGQLAEAERLLAESIDLERDYAMRFRDVRGTEVDRVERLLRKLETVRSTAAKGGLDEITRSAAAAETAREWTRAADLWAEAARGMEALIAAFPQSSHADRRLLVEFARRQSLALAMPEVERFRLGMEEVRAQLRKGDTAQADVLASAIAARLGVLLQKFPEAIPAADVDRRQLEVVRERSGTLALVRDAFVSQLVDLPGNPGRRILRTEVPQSLFVAVSGSNPSAKREPAFPVESLSYGEAEEFARRLGWLTGLRVRLPRQEEHLAAHGDLGRRLAPDEAWTIDTSDGRVRPVGTSRANAAGIHDLVGNVAEWLQADQAGPSALVAGGDAQSAPPDGIPLDLVGRGDTSRLRGFRVVVEP